MPGSASTANQKKKPIRSASPNVGANRAIWLALIIVLVAGLDQATKYWALHSLAGQPGISVWGNFIMFSLVFNEGGAMGTALGPSVFYLVLTLLVMPFIFYYLWRSRYELAVAVPLALVCGGAIGNLTDRIRLGRVVDFIDVDVPDISLFGFQLTRFWTFNVADAAISCAIAYLFIRLFIQAKSRVPVESDPVSATPSDYSDDTPPN